MLRYPPAHQEPKSLYLESSRGATTYDGYWRHRECLSPSKQHRSACWIVSLARCDFSLIVALGSYHGQLPYSSAPVYLVVQQPEYDDERKLDNQRDIYSPARSAGILRTRQAFQRTPFGTSKVMLQRKRKRER